MTFVLPQKARVVRRLVMSPLSPTVVDEEEEWFSSYLVPPDLDSGVDNDDPPRDSPPGFLRFAIYPVGPLVPPVRSGERIETLDEVYEVLGKKRDLRTGRRVAGHEIAVLPVSFLYPHEGILKDNGGEELRTVNFSLYGTTELVAERGGYQEYTAETSIDQAPYLKPNRTIAVVGGSLHITRAYVPPGAPRVVMTLRLKDLNG